MSALFILTALWSAQALPQPQPTHVPARIRAAREIRLSAEVGGKVIQRPAARNSVVKKGDPILVIDPTFHRLAVRSAEAGVKMAEADARFAKAELARVRRMAKTDAVTEASMEEAVAAASRSEAAVARAQVVLEDAQEKLARSIIRAPTNGALSELHPEVGELVRPGTPVAEILTVDDLVAESFVEPAHVLAVKPGMSIVVVLPKSLGGSLQGKVREVASAAGPSRTFRVVVSIPNPPAGLRAGFDAQLAIPRAR